MTAVILLSTCNVQTLFNLCSFLCDNYKKLSLLEEELKIYHLNSGATDRFCQKVKLLTALGSSLLRSEARAVRPAGGAGASGIGAWPGVCSQGNSGTSGGAG